MRCLHGIRGTRSRQDGWHDISGNYGSPRTLRSQFPPPRRNFVSTLSDVVFPARPHPFQLQSAPGRGSMSRAAVIASFFPSLSVLHYCQHAPFFRPAAGFSLPRARASTHGVVHLQGSAVSICRPEKTRRRDLIHVRWIPARRPRRCASKRARGRITTAGRLSERKFRSARGNFLRERALARFLTSPFLPRASLVILPRLPRA